MSTPRQLLLACGAARAIALPSLLDAQEFWTPHGFTEDDVKSRLLHALTGSSFNPPPVPSLRAMPAAARNSLVSSAASYTKRWTQSADFRQRYAEMRDLNKPEMPEAAMTVAQRKAKDKAEFEKAIVSMDSALAQAKGHPEVQAGVRNMIQQLREQIKAVDDPANPAYVTHARHAFTVALPARPDVEHGARRAAPDHSESRRKSTTLR